MGTVNSGFTLDRKMNELMFRSAKLASREWLAQNYVRVRLQGDDLAGFDSPGSDDHIRLFSRNRPPKRSSNFVKHRAVSTHRLSGATTGSTLNLLCMVTKVLQARGLQKPTLGLRSVWVGRAVP